jgi:hypothetical protein
MKTKHTPGPWVIDRDTEIWGADGKLVANVLHNGMNDGEDNVDYAAFRANSALIEAAPELLEAVKTIQAFLDSSAGNPCPRPIKALILGEIEAAIAKAEGLKTIYL